MYNNYLTLSVYPIFIKCKRISLQHNNCKGKSKNSNNIIEQIVTMARCDPSFCDTISLTLTCQIRGTTHQFTEVISAECFLRGIVYKTKMCVCTFSLLKRKCVSVLLVYIETNIFKLQMGACLDHSSLVGSPKT